MNRKPLPLISSTRSLYHHFLVNRVMLSRAFVNATIINTIASFGLPTLSRDFSVLTFMRNQALVYSKQQTYDHLDIFPSDFLIERLPPPFDTRCSTQDSHVIDDCIRDCVRHAFSENDTMPTNGIIMEPIDKRILGLTNVNTSSAKSWVEGVVEACDNKCFFSPCRQVYCKTVVYPILKSQSSLGFSTRTPHEPDIATEYVAFSSFVCKKSNRPSQTLRVTCPRSLPSLV